MYDFEGLILKFEVFLEVDEKAPANSSMTREEEQDSGKSSTDSRFQE